MALVHVSDTVLTILVTVLYTWDQISVEFLFRLLCVLWKLRELSIVPKLGRNRRAEHWSEGAAGLTAQRLEAVMLGQKAFAARPCLTDRSEI